MPIRKDIKTILVIGSGPIVIGQACEFDYSGTQSCKALKEEGFRVILINSNPATIMTDPDIADETYIEPIHWKIIEKIIKREKPEAILPTMGGQTALNCVMQLYEKKILYKYKVEIIGVTIDAIKKSENRKLFKKAMKEIHLTTAKSKIANSINSAEKILNEVGLPCIVRSSFTMGGSGSGIATNFKEFKKICKSALESSPISQVQIDESLIGWKEFEIEIIKDSNNNSIVVCSIENIDPMGIHTGDSITIAPAQTLTDKEYQYMRNSSISILKKIGIKTGGSNVQFALNPENGKIIVIEVNPRVSRSSALASKATGYPIARIVTKLSVGYTLDELENNITKNNITASFEPSIDYIVTKMPKFNFEKFQNCNDRLTTQMKSVGEIMSIGRTFKESLQKGLCSLESGINGFSTNINKIKNKKKIEYELRSAGPNRILYIADAIRIGYNLNKIFNLTKIDKWFLNQFFEIIKLEKKISKKNKDNISIKFLKLIKKSGFSDSRIAYLMKTTEDEIRRIRYENKLYPVYKRIDMCSAEFPSKTSYMYSTWEDECESNPTKNKNKVLIIGSGPNRIGQGIEFDYCCVHAAIELKKMNFETIMINCNPETVSTDYNISDRLYFEPITIEHVLNIINIEKPIKILIQYGGQTPLKLSKKLSQEKIKILGTSIQSIHKTENREEFKKVIKHLNLKQPKNSTVTNLEQALLKSKKIGYPIIIRPSYVLGGKNMEIVYSDKELKNHFKKIYNKNNKKPILLDHYLENAIEIDVDAICDKQTVFIAGILEHIEKAGIHSGDSACTIPTYTISKNIKNKLVKQSKKLSIYLKIKGMINIQFAIKNDKIYILEVNPRASRTIPFISKSIGIPLAKIASKVMCGITLKEQNITQEVITPYYSIKESIFPFNKFYDSDYILGPEMKSTGEIMGIGRNFSEAFSKIILSHNTNINRTKKVCILIKKSEQKKIINISKKLKKLGYTIYTTKNIYNFLKKHKIRTLILKIEKNEHNILHDVAEKKFGYIINTLNNKKNNKDFFLKIIKIAIKHNIYFDTTIRLSNATVYALNKNPINHINSLQKLHKKIKYKI
ncbi:carbamoyl-phosphate synthase large subunit [Buchnera aphidicola (Chaitoregma tattakana)]|uniref:carbamoyl-phosphate synthase large subunit n=1 Tax=Buchnera aphidicola TaxID=9 RepID=UPI0031B84DC7